MVQSGSGALADSRQVGRELASALAMGEHTVNRNLSVSPCRPESSALARRQV